MSNSLALQFRTTIDEFSALLENLPASIADVACRQEGWTGGQIVGHLIDSAANNRQRFVRASIDGRYYGPGYEQDQWVIALGYREQSWDTLLRWWRAEHEILVAVVEHIPEQKLAAECIVEDSAPVTLSFLITDYLRHQRHHFEQLKSGLLVP
ncbi:MAG: DinB family protein [Terracidiphilus sp.]|nr:DinB family protein [Terracidiphilus sp.]